MDRNSTDITILFKNAEWHEEHVFLTEVASSRAVDEKLEAMSKNTWQTMLHEAAATGRQLWDSEIYRLEDVDICTHTLSLNISTVPFSVRVGMNDHTERVRQLGLAYAPKGLYTSCLVSTTDHHYVFIEKSNIYFTKKKYAWVGGVLSKTERHISSGKELFDTVRTEVMEELGVESEQITSTTLSAGYVSENWNACLLFTVELKLTTHELQAMFMKQSDDEAVELVMIAKSNLHKESNIFDSKDRTKFAVLDLF